MERKHVGEFRLSRLMLGTVQFGLSYGIANASGRPPYTQVLEILETAVAGGVNCLDTAAAYGDSEAVLGRALRELDLLERMVVVTKVRALTPKERNEPAVARKAVAASVEQSRSRLGMDRLPIVLFHREDDAAYLDVLETLVERGWIGHAGVSCGHDPVTASQFVADARIHAVQLPCNLLDRRHRQRGTLAAADNTGTAAFVRSVYLQGLLLMPETAVPAALRDVLPARRKLEAIAASAGMPMTEMAVRYALSLEGVTSILTGVETPRQLKENIAILARGPLDADTLRQIDAAANALREDLITPALWPAKEAAKTS